jgi:hypothetical protein
MVGMDERYPVSVAGVDLIADRPARRGARMLHDDQELPRDVWGKYQFTGIDGQPHRLEMTYSYSHLSPALRVDDATDVIVLEPLPRWAHVIRILYGVVGSAGILIHGYLLMGASLGALFLLTRPGRGPRQLILAAAIGVVALVAQVLLFILR